MESGIFPFYLHIFFWKKVLVKFNKMKKIVGQIRGENIRGRGVRNFFNALPPQGKSETTFMAVTVGAVTVGRCNCTKL